jgi:hypothetical protein
MYCSTCGVAVAQGLSYCNYCGAKLSTAREDSAVKPPAVKPELLVAAMTALFMFGLLVIIILIGMVKSVLGLPVGQVLALALLPFLLLVLLEGVFIRLLLRGKRNPDEPGNTVVLQGHATRELDAAQARGLPEPVSSVTESTTRTLEPIHRERASK